MTNNNNGNNNNNNVEMGYRRPGGEPRHEVDWMAWTVAIYFAAVIPTVLGAAVACIEGITKALH